MSIAGGLSVCGADLQRLIDRVVAKKIFVVAAAGNNFQKPLPEPANCKGVISVGALDAENKIEVYSALDPRTVIYAPGGGKQLSSSANWANNKLMVATYELDFLGQERPASLERGVGTSFAAPIVSGFISLKQLKIKVRFEHLSSGGGGSGGGSSFDLNHVMNEAMSDAQISVEYQPIQRMSDGGIFGMEVVVCWRQPSGETLYVSPADFVTLADKSGLVLPFDTWVLETACRQAAEWQRHYGPLILALNLSQTQFNDPMFAKRVRGICEAAQYPYQLLEFEINVAVLSRNLESSLAQIKAFVGQGLSLTVDGFGLTKLSASLLDSLVLQKVKLDHRLVINASRDSEIEQLLKQTFASAIEKDIQVTADQQCRQDALRDSMSQLFVLLNERVL
jgi:EAL domain-containing protein (putative c-di-GMP-specific phosphodiesterase class I)